MKILITGTSSGIGKALKKELQEFEIIEVCRRCEYSIDLNNIQEVKKLKTKVKLLESQIEKLSKEVKTDFLTKISNKKAIMEELNKQERIEEALRLSYNFNDFKQTKLYSDLNSWQQNNNVLIFKT